jgi:hypothetical protein
MQSIVEGRAKGINAASWSHPGLEHLHVMAPLKQFIGSDSSRYPGAHNHNFLRNRPRCYARITSEYGRHSESSRMGYKLPTIQGYSPFAS